MAKRFLFTMIMSFIITLSFAQPRMAARHVINLSEYVKVDSFPLERIAIHFNKEIDDDNALPLGDGDYLIKMPHKDRILIKKNEDETKAIVIYNSYCFGRHLEFNIKDDKKRTILWYKDKNTYCGYIYDKDLKVCKYFESKKEYKRFMRYK